MKIRKGFVTNSSSTNFIVISDEELSFDYLYKKLGSNEDSVFDEEIRELCYLILNKAQRLEFYNIDELADQYGIQLKKVYKQLKKKSLFVYTGTTSSDNDDIESFLTCEPIEFKTKGFYFNGLNCVW